MAFAIPLFLIAAASAFLAMLFQGEAWLLLWPSVCFLVLSFTYAFNVPQMLGKKSSGTIVWPAILFFFPYFLMTWILWHLLRCLSSEPSWNVAASGIWIGRRLLHSELPPEIDVIVDLTAEFVESRRVRDGKRYRCLPILDASIPDMAVFRPFVDEVAKTEGSIFIHCASGHGRTGLFAAALLLARGLSASADDAIRMLRAARPAVRLNRVQKRFLQGYAASAIEAKSNDSTTR